jgi:hypothetical protein
MHHSHQIDVSSYDGIRHFLITFWIFVLCQRLFLSTVKRRYTCRIYRSISVFFISPKTLSNTEQQWSRHAVLRSNAPFALMTCPYALVLLPATVEHSVCRVVVK